MIPKGRIIHSMRIIFGILSFCTAGIIAYHISPGIRQNVIPYWFHGQSSGGFIQIRLGPFLLEDRGICVVFAGLVLLVIVLIVAGIYAFSPRDTKVPL